VDAVRAAVHAASVPVDADAPARSRSDPAQIRLGIAVSGIKRQGLTCGFKISALTIIRRRTMSKGMDRKKEAKKKPAKSLQEKRAAKREKKQSRGFQV